MPIQRHFGVDRRNQSATMVSFKEMLGMSRVGVQARAGRMTELPGDPPQRVAPRRILREASERCASHNAADVASDFGRTGSSNSAPRLSIDSKARRSTPLPGDSVRDVPPLRVLRRAASGSFNSSSASLEFGSSASEGGLSRVVSVA